MSHRLPVVLGMALPLLVAMPRAQRFELPASPQMRFVDFHARLDQPGVVVAIGRLDKWKEGKRERLADGKLGGAGSVTVLSGTQYFKVPTKAVLRPQFVFGGAQGDKDDADRRLRLEFDLQLARLPDGTEQRQMLTGNGARLQEEALALFVVAPPEKGSKRKGLELLHVIPFDARLDEGPDGEAKFVDTMYDFYVVNRRVADLERALAAVEAGDDADDAAAQKAALAQLKELVEHAPEMRDSRNDALLMLHAGPLQARAHERLAAPAKDAAESDGGK